MIPTMVDSSQSWLLRFSRSWTPQPARAQRHWTRDRPGLTSPMKTLVVAESSLHRLGRRLAPFMMQPVSSRRVPMQLSRPGRRLFPHGKRTLDGQPSCEVKSRRHLRTLTWERRPSGPPQVPRPKGNSFSSSTSRCRTHSLSDHRRGRAEEVAAGSLRGPCTCSRTIR